MTIPYTYRIFSKITSEYYYGVRWAKNCHPNDLFVSYFTSSNSVKKLIEIYGKDNFIIEIRKIFDSKNKAIEWERRVNRWTMKWPNYLNKHSNGNFILTDEERKEIGTRAGNKCRDLKLGFHGMSAEGKIAAVKKGAETNRRNSTGIYAISHDDRIDNGIKCKDKKLGWHSDEIKQKRIESNSKPWWTDGIHTVKSNESPGPEWKKGRKRWSKTWWNNGIEEINVGKRPVGTWRKGKLK